MRVNRRHFLAGAAGAGTAAMGAAAPRPSFEDLDRAAAQPVLRRDSLRSPVVIDSMRLMKKGKEYIVRVRSKDGAEGVSLTNPPRADYLATGFPEADRAVFHRQGCERPGQPALGPLSLAEQLQDVRAGAVEPASLGGVRNSRHAGANREQAPGRTRSARSCGARFPSMSPVRGATPRRSRRSSTCARSSRNRKPRR